MLKNKEERIRIFQVVSLGEELACEEIAKILKKDITLNPEKPDVYFTVTEHPEESIVVKG
ncbi:MAG: hypothetical protein K9L86_07215 [Candidatus Omnitrophica bacterium]|nr:hypothetical protein [Candidatus Omnitrophota bacterium]